ncbi:MAG: bifunctional riboflavin kinase/FMN adenylyltransferase [Lentimicrobium sp.]|jgi:riboflavin kinase/FMN adenylyltransferase|nr:bifunctional riboflavin kinase/FMN adenylyltransferase [Lentimicrobium sp.]MDD2526423.1 bifunctional riboflavin kinase/FMN adenylyltransferase [Lentimicrobiaceae bacterium]MDD4597345.1 bifunctional riboflavin kinase/FMN adenylyltransferase [Lentimicrobiaceae bacterium]MDY0026391.1 bifunctional riboflavin kinase/FMN adenylyltransferase [Lentimicrobium sp.]HAH57826.1 riboflavin biosynthesis protein RibF [Bacteroidales bacterium]
MRIFYDPENLPSIPNPVVTTGSFDGVHVGHKTILNRLNEIARNIGGESVLITFHPHPRKVLFPDTAGKSLLLINSQREKIELLKRAGLNNLIIFTFTPEFAHISSIDFIRNILVGRLHAKKVVIGFNHHFGHNREGNFDYLYELGQYYHFGVEEIPEQDIHNETVSSTLIRKALLEGKIQRANAYLDHLYIIIGTLQPGSDTCRQINFPTMRIAIEDENKLVPCDGVYAVSIMVRDVHYKGIVNIKNSLMPEIRNVDEIIIDIHFFEKDGFLPGDEATLFFAKRIRDELHFSNDEEMKMQLKQDYNEVNELIY